MRRLYFLSPNITSAKKIFEDLLLARVDDHHIHVVANDERELVREKIPVATVLEKTDIIPGLERGLVVGFATGVILSVGLLLFPPGDFVLGGGAVLGITLAGAVFGAWISSMIGISIHNSQLVAFDDAIEKGEFLFIIDVPKKRVEDIVY